MQYNYSFVGYNYCVYTNSVANIDDLKKLNTCFGKIFILIQQGLRHWLVINTQILFELLSRAL